MNAKLAATGLVSLLALGGIPYCATQYTVSEGQRIGTIHKFSKKGIFCKTYEGQLGLDAGDSSSVGRGSWNFSVNDQSIVEKVQAASDSGEKVRVQYHEQLLVPFWVGETDYLVVDVKKVKP